MLAFQRRIFMTKSYRAIFSAAALLASMHVEAQHDFERSLVYMLPVYCKYAPDFNQRNFGGHDPTEVQRWRTLMGPTFIHIHHYCYGLMDVNRAVFLAKTREDRMHNYYQSVNEFDYVIERATPDFSLLPEVLTKKGESLIALGRAGEAMFEFERAIKIKPDYSPAYAAASDFYKENGKLGKAREWLAKGLSAAPDASALKRRLAELDKLKDKSGAARRPTGNPAAPSSPD